ncbi:MAG: ABC transporter permease [Dehalococcoidia bacterium]
MQTRSAEGAVPLRLGKKRHALLDFLVRLFRTKPLGAIGLVLVVLLVLTAVFADLIAPYGFNESALADRFAPPSSRHWLGADENGRDVFSRVVYGARISMYVGLGTVALGMLGAVLIGMLTGYFGGGIDMGIQRVVDAWMSFPGLVIAIVIMSLLGPGLVNVIVTLSLGQAFTQSRVIRGATLAVRAEQYVEAARALGAGHGRILGAHLLPNVMAPIIIVATNSLSFIILAEAAISFLGFGVPPPQPSWGGMLSGTARQHMLRAPWMAIWPGVALSMAVFAFSMLGDALRDLLDPRLRGSR